HVAGCLISETELLDRCRHLSEETASATAIDWLAIPTCNRPDHLRRAIRSYAASATAFGRPFNVFIADDSPSPEQRATSRSLLRRLRTECGVSITYAGKEEKLAFAQALLARRDIPPEPVHLA